MPRFIPENNLEYEVTQNSNGEITIQLSNPEGETIITRFEYETEEGEKKSIEIPVNKWN